MNLFIQDIIKVTYIISNSISAITCWLQTFYFLHSAHDNDLKEANKQKCPLQQSGPQAGQAMYSAQSQSATVAQYVHRPTLQYAQQSCQPVLVSAHASGAYLCHSGSLQVSSGPSHGQAQPQTISVPLDAKMKVPNRSYQVNSVYSCTAPCFNRWLQLDASYKLSSWLFKGHLVNNKANSENDGNTKLPSKAG